MEVQGMLILYNAIRVQEGIKIIINSGAHIPIPY